MWNTSAVAPDRFLEAKSSVSTTTPLRPPPVKLDNKEHKAEKRGRMKKLKKNASPFHPSLIPQLYATPESTRIPDSADSSFSSFPPSPYVVDHKRRGPGLVKSFSQDDVAAVASLDESPRPCRSLSQADLMGFGGDLQEAAAAEEEEDYVSPRRPAAAADGHIEDEKVDGASFSARKTVISDQKFRALSVDTMVTAATGDFFDPRGSMSVASSAEAETSDGLERTQKLPLPPGTPMGEFYDAFEEISNEAITPSLQTMEKELREMRLNLLMDMERRKQAEESVCNLERAWQRLSHRLSLVGFTLPPISSVMDDGDRHMDKKTEEELQQQVIILRLVSGSIGRGCARAEMEQDMESLIKSKNFEIARLWDRLQYYEAANREMSQRNQEAVERARQQRIGRKRKQKWIWLSFGFAVSMAAAAVTWSYFSVSTADCLPVEANNADNHKTN